MFESFLTILSIIFIANFILKYLEFNKEEEERLDWEEGDFEREDRM